MCGNSEFSVTTSDRYSWNKVQGQMIEIALKDLRPSKIKWILADKFILKFLMYFLFEYCFLSLIYE